MCMTAVKRFHFVEVLLNMIIFFVLSHAGVKNIVCYPKDFVTHMYLEFCYLQVPLHCKPIGGAN